MGSRTILTVALLGLGGSLAGGAELVGVPGSGVQYATPVAATVGGKDVTLALTGTALRKKLVFKVYAIGSYLAEGVAAGSAEELIAADAPKRLHLVLERDVTGADMAEAFRTAIRLNQAAPAFDEQIGELAEFMKPLTVRQGDHVWLTHVPGVGLHCQVPGQAEVTIADVAFARAVWEIYLGTNNLGEEIKRGLVSRLR